MPFPGLVERVPCSAERICREPLIDGIAYGGFLETGPDCYFLLGERQRFRVRPRDFLPPEPWLTTFRCPLSTSQRQKVELSLSAYPWSVRRDS